MSMVPTHWERHLHDATYIMCIPNAQDTLGLNFLGLLTDPDLK